MQTKSFTGAAMLLAFAPTALAIGSAHVVNNCGFDVYYASVAQFVASPMIKLPAGGMTEQYHLPGVGVSVKVATSPTGPVTQFEYTWASGNINYDISNINGNPFLEHGMSLTPSVSHDASHPSCLPVVCAPGESPCNAAYNAPNDVRTMVCGQESDLTFTLCPATQVKREVDAAPSLPRMHARHLPKL